MITDRYAEERIRSWLIATAPRHLPDRVLTDTYERTRRMAQASSVRTWWSRVTRPLPIVFAAGAIAIVLVAVSVGLGTSEPSTSDDGCATRERGDRRAVDDRCEHGGHDRAGPDRRRTLLLAGGRVRPDRPARLSSSTTSTVERAPGSARARGDGRRRRRRRAHSRWRSRFGPDRSQPQRSCRPATPLFVDRGVRATTVGEDGYFATVERDGGGALHGDGSRPRAGTAPTPPTESALRGSRNRLPSRDRRPRTRPEVPGMFGPNTACAQRRDRPDSRLGGAVRRRAARWSRCSRVQHLSSMTPTSATSTAGTMSTAECFATYRARLLPALRHDDGGRSCATSAFPRGSSPGFLPGERAAGSSIEVVSTSRAHCLGRGVLPGLRVGHVRSDRGRCGGLSWARPRARRFQVGASKPWATMSRVPSMTRSRSRGSIAPPPSSTAAPCTPPTRTPRRRPGARPAGPARSSSSSDCDRT